MPGETGYRHTRLEGSYGAWKRSPVRVLIAASDRLHRLFFRISRASLTLVTKTTVRPNGVFDLGTVYHYLLDRLQLDSLIENQGEYLRL